MSELITQLRQCFTKKIKLHNGDKQIPDAVYLASPFQISQRLLNEIHDLLCMDNKKVEILDGPKVISLLKKHKPSLLEGLLSISDKLQLHDLEQLNNLELIAALNQKKSIDELNCYSDLAFFMGTIDSNILLDSEFLINKENISLAKGYWDLFNREIYRPLENLLEFTPLVKNSHDVEITYQDNLKKHKSEANLKIKKDISQVQQLISTNIQSVKRIIEEILSSVSAMVSKKNEDYFVNVISEFYSILKVIVDSNFPLEKIRDVDEYIESMSISKLAEKQKSSVFSKVLEAKKSVL
ncbi:hypothetical protein LJN55_16295 [Erwinia rhapontici]|uniref:hypothetical protein n=1 Tax=Erwinia rhapontici TaxID=55212 RepID=UPI001D0DBF1F|nr:hypothetical protein [Erwinia rhapontici]UDQ79016.1 hypothetical protein LJN55_16295 [Erwinia rhapontici]